MRKNIKRIMIFVLMLAFILPIGLGMGLKAEEGDDALTVWCWDPAFNIYAMEEAARSLSRR